MTCRLFPLCDLLNLWNFTACGKNGTKLCTFIIKRLQLQDYVPNLKILSIHFNTNDRIDSTVVATAAMTLLPAKIAKKKKKKTAETSGAACMHVCVCVCANKTMYIHMYIQLYKCICTYIIRRHCAQNL